MSPKNTLNLQEILKVTGGKLVSKNQNITTSQVIILGVSCDSRDVRQGDVFVAIKGEASDGNEFIAQAVNKGAVVVVTSDKNYVKRYSLVFFVYVKDTRLAFSQIVNAYYNYPSDKLKVIGVTGTNGKTTVSHLIYNVLKIRDKNTGLVGTINNIIANKKITAVNTTPSSKILNQYIDTTLKNKGRYLTIEVSSHSLHQKRVYGLNFNTAVFTNLTPEHLDYHSNMDDYFKAKQMLFTGLKLSSSAIINIDDKFGSRLYNYLCRYRKDIRLFTYSLNSKINSKNNIYAKNINLSFNGVSFIMVTPKGKIAINSKLIGQYNILNILAAGAVCLSLGFSLKKIKNGIEKVKNIKGRMQRISNNKKNVFIDYAHTDDALQNVLKCLKMIDKNKRIILVFGCGGNRDVRKRSRMGRIADEYADYFILTSDNPRSENPKKIIKDIEKGISSDKKYDVIPDRKAAIENALDYASASDIVLIAGKGHENYQLINNKKIDFDDRKVVLNKLNN